MRHKRPVDEARRDYFAEWCYEHPYTMGYIALAITVLLILNVIEVFQGFS